MNRNKLMICFFSVFVFFAGKGFSQNADALASSDADKKVYAKTCDTGSDTIKAEKNTDVGALQGKAMLDEIKRILYAKKIKDTAALDKKDSAVEVKASDPFAFGDFSWLNGTSRKSSPPAFDSKYFTGDVTFDFNYTHSYNNPIDNTVVGSTALARNNELQLSFMGVGGDIHVNNVRGRVMMQFGTRSTVVPRNDGSSANYLSLYQRSICWLSLGQMAWHQSRCRYFYVLHRLIFLQQF